MSLPTSHSSSSSLSSFLAFLPFSSLVLGPPLRPQQRPFWPSLAVASRPRRCLNLQKSALCQCPQPWNRPWQPVSLCSSPCPCPSCLYHLCPCRPCPCPCHLCPLLLCGPR